MNRSVHFLQQLLPLGIPLLIIGSMIFLARSSWFEAHPEELAMGITFDLIITVPFVYFLLIRKREIPKITVVPFFVVGIVIASFIIPKDHQFYLSQVKYWVLPVVELAALSFVIYKVRATVKQFKQERLGNPDFFTAIKNAASAILPDKVAPLFATEIAVVYYGFIRWKKRRQEANEFAYHKESASVALFSIVIVMILVETFALHLLIQRWSEPVAWVLSILSFYTGLQVFGIVRSFSQRPYIVGEKSLYLKYGILSEMEVPYHQIESIEVSDKELEWDKKTRKLSPLGQMESHNVILRFKEELTVAGLYGIKNNCRTLALHVDDKEGLVKEIEQRMK